MGTGDADGVFILLHDGAPGFRALKNGDALPAGGGNFGVVIVNSGGADDELRALDVAGRVPHVDGDAQAPQMIHHGAAGLVAALDRQAHAVKDLRQRAHGDAADARQMDPAARSDVMLNFGINMGHGTCFLPKRQSPAGICLFRRNVLYYKKLMRATIFY